MAENLSERSHLFQSEQTDLQDTHGNNYHDEDIRNKTKGSTSGEDKKIENGDHIISAKYESLDYDTIENELYQQEGRIKTKSAVWKEFNRWLVMGLVGVITGLIASFIDYMVVQATQLKFGYVHQYIEFCVKNLCLEEPFLIWIAFNAVLVFIGSFLTSFIEPVAAGSGIPQIKCFLNGVKIPHVVRLKTIVCKVLGVICAVAGGLVVGKEGPMIHSGAVVAAGISQGKIDALHLDLKIFEYFRSDTEKRDFVSGGAAAGVSAAFGAPVGGVLFSLEEGASFWNQALTWRIFFASMISTFTLNIVQSYIKDKPWNLSYPGLFNFGSFDKTDYSGFEIPLFVIMGVVGGLIGALFNHINYKLSVFRIRFVKKKWMHVVEAIIVAVLTGTVGYITLYFLNDCQPPKTDEQYESAQIFCDDGQYSTTSSVLFQTPEESVKKMFHEPPGTYGAETLVVYGICCFLLACWTYGLYVPSGLFIPSLLIGAIWGRLFGMLLNVIFPDMNWVNLEKYSLIGAAAQLGGIVRMTISLTVIIVEASGNITFGLPVMIVLMVAKWIGDLFNEGIYDMHIHLQGVPLLGWEPSSMLSNINAMEVMSHPVTVFRTVESVGRIVDVLKQDNYNGFPVVSDYDPFVEHTTEHEAETFGTYQGTILRSQLIVLLKQKAFEENEDIHHIRSSLKTKDFREAYPRFPPIHQIHISQHERDFNIDLRPYINPSAYTVTDEASFPRIFRLFRGLGLRHVVVLNQKHQVVGMVTRKDLARYKISRQFGKVSMSELSISS